MSAPATAALPRPAPAILQVVPRLPAAAEGVGGYAAALAQGLAAGAGIESRFLVADRASELADGLAGIASTTDAVLVHYANYGYANRGCPGWLVGGLVEWRRRSGGRSPLVSFFHEVYASGPPWRSSFWLSPVQRRLAAALARASDRVVTSLDLYRDLLARWVPAAAITVLPVFSTVGEATAPVPLAERRRRLIVFGGPGGRARVYSEHGRGLAAACAALGVEEIADIGPGTSTAAAVVEGVPVRRLGELPAAQVSALLAGSLAGFVAHRPAFLGKSTVFAAYCAHGMLPVATAREAEADSRLWTPSRDAGDAALQTRADAAAAWYAEHSIGRQMAVFQRLLAGPAGEAA